MERQVKICSVLLVISTVVILYALIFTIPIWLVYAISIFFIPLWILSLGLITMAKPRKEDKEARVKASMPFYVSIIFILAVVWIVGVIVGPVTKNSLLIIFAVYAIYKIVEHNAGSSSGSPYGKMSCVRAVLSAATELPLFASIALIYFKTGTMNIYDILMYQNIHGPLISSIPLAAFMFFTLLLTKSPYSPFAITKGKDLVTGFETEHFGFLRGFLMMSESIAWYVMLWLFLVLFFGPISIVWLIVGMILISVITGFINATTPMLNPNHSVMTQITICFVCFAGTIIMIFI